MTTDLATLAKTAYIYGYALVYNLDEVIGMTTHPKVGTSGPVNLFAHATKLADPKDAFVSINNDTLYSMAQ